MELPDWLINLPPEALHLVLFVALFVEGIGVPGIPFELVWVAQGFLIHAEKTTLAEAVFWGTLGNGLGNVVGYLFGHKIAAYLPKKVREAVQFEEVKRWYDRHGVWVIVVSRWFGFFRTPFILYAGLAGVRFWTYTWSSFLGAALWVWVWQWGLWKFGEVFLVAWARYQPLILVGIFAVSVLALVWLLVLRKRPAVPLDSGES